MHRKKISLVQSTPEIDQQADSLAAIEKLNQENLELKLAYERLLSQTNHALMKCLELRDPYTYGHSMRVMEYAVMIGKGAGLSIKEMKNLELSSMYHDIGKIGVRDCVLLKDGPLSPTEGRAIKEHPEYGIEVLENIDEYKDIAQGVLHHHERLDGKGYPNAIHGEEIPLYSRIILVADTFDAMTTTRPYRKLLNIEVAYQELKKYSGTQFDEEFVKIFLREHQKMMGTFKQKAKIIQIQPKITVKKAA